MYNNNVTPMWELGHKGIERNESKILWCDKKPYKRRISDLETKPNQAELV